MWSSGLVRGVRAPLLVALLALPALAGCFGGDDDARAGLVPYPRMGDVATYDATGALVELTRWNNGVPFAAASAQVRFTLSQAPDALDAARQVHHTFRVTTEVAEAGVFGKRSERYVSAPHSAIVQAVYPLSTDQNVVSFDERGFPWLFGASALFGEALAPGARYPVALPDNLGRGATLDLSWEVVGEESLDGRTTTKLELRGTGATGALWMTRESAWPQRVQLTITDALAPRVRSDGGYPATIDARLASLSPGHEPLPARDSGATFSDDALVARASWDGEKPPDGTPSAFAYPLADAVRDAKLLDRQLAAWLDAADAPILYRATYQNASGPVQDTTSELWLLQFVDKGDNYYETQISRLTAPPLPVAGVAPAGVPRIEKSGVAEAPADANHGWFDPGAIPDALVPISEAVRIVQATFDAPQVQLFLRSFTDPPGYSYFIDGGFERDERFTVVYNPSTGLLEQATGPVTARLL